MYFMFEVVRLLHSFLKVMHSTKTELRADLLLSLYTSITGVLTQKQVVVVSAAQLIAGNQELGEGEF